MIRASLVLPLLRASAAEPQPAYRPRRVAPHIVLYRRRTEALLRRYLRLSLEVGRAPSLLGRELFRAKVSSYRMESFEDVVIFLHDIERCLARLDPGQQELIARLALQEYTVTETATMLCRTPTTLIRQYNAALDSLTRAFLAVRMLQPIPGTETDAKSCQEAKTADLPVSRSCRGTYGRKKFGD